MLALKFYISSVFVALYWRDASTASMDESEAGTYLNGSWNYYDLGPSKWPFLNESYCGSNFKSQSGRDIDFNTVKNGFHLDGINNTINQSDTNLFNHWNWTPDHTRWEIKNTGHALKVVK